MADRQYTAYETLHGGRVARIYLNRPKARNAQNFGLLGEVHEANRAHWTELTKGEAAIGTPELGVSGERRPLQPAERTSSGLPA